MKAYLDAQTRQSADLLIGRWMADYEDPDDFTFALFHSAGGHMKTVFSSPETDRLAEEARMEGRSAVRESLYRRIESLLLESGVLIPLFHEVDYRIAGPGVRGVALRSSPPFINYPEIGKSEAPAAHVTHEWGGGVIHVPIGGVVHDFDPASMAILEQAETMPLVFETLTRDLEAGASFRGSPRKWFPRRAARASASACGGACVSTTAARFPPATSGTPSSAFSRRERPAAGSSSPRSAEPRASSTERPRISRASTSSALRSS